MPTVPAPRFQYTDLIPVPAHLLLDSESVDDMIDYVYEDLENIPDGIDYLAERAILTPLNATANDINDHILNTHWREREHIELLSSDTVSQDDDDGQIQPEHLNDITAASIPNHRLRLKQGVILMLMCNLNRAAGLCNGTRLIFDRVVRNVLKVTIATGSHRGETAYIPRVCLTPNDVHLPFTLIRRQYPVKLAFCMTVTLALYNGCLTLSLPFAAGAQVTGADTLEGRHPASASRIRTRTPVCGTQSHR